MIKRKKSFYINLQFLFILLTICGIIMNLLYLTFGENINNHIQAHFSICSFLTQHQKVSSINVVTDRPDLYEDIKRYINVVTVDEKLLTEWKGEYDFFWRIKIKAIEMLCAMHKNQPVLYLDADTFLYTNLELLRSRLLQGIALMHEDEGKLSELKGKTLGKMWKQVKNNSYGGVAMLPSHAMWNAGVVGTPNQKNNEECLLALAICDEMCKQGVTPRLIEQFALSVALNEVYGLQAADNAIAHYWSNKDEWNSLIKDLFITAQFRSDAVEKIIETIKQLDFKFAVKVKHRNTNTRLKSFVEKTYPAEHIAFVKNSLHQV